MPTQSRSDGTRTRLRGIVKDLRLSLVGGLGPQERAFAALSDGSDRHPWTAEAERLWRNADGRDPWHDHHLAILLHARAYDLEQEGAEEAFDYWREAITYWAVLLVDDDFWATLGAHLAEHMGAPVESGTIAKTRAELPRMLLAPQVHLVEMHKPRHPARARKHLELIKESGFDAELIDEIRSDMVRDVVDGVPAATEARRFEQILTELRSWLEVDTDNASIAQALLFAFRKRSEQLWNEVDGFTQIEENVRQADAVLIPLLGCLPSPTGSMARELARHLYWRAFATWHAARERFAFDAPRSVLEAVAREGRNAVGWFRDARELDDGITRDSYYRDIDMIEGQAEKLSGMCCLVSKKADGECDHVGAAQHLRRAIRLHGTDFEAFYFLVQALLSPPSPSDEAMAEAETLLKKAQAVAKSPDEVEAHERLTSQLSLQRTMRRMQSTGSGSLDPDDFMALLRRIQRDS